MEVTRLIRFEDAEGVARLGLWEPDPRRESLGTARLIEGDLFGRWRPTDAVVRVRRLRAPVDPPNIYGIGLNYREHAAEGKRDVPDKPLIFIKATTSVIDPGAPIELPKSAPNKVDFEAELAVVIGRRARDVPESRVAEYLLGYTCANDVTARDCQKELDGQWARAKSFDTFCPLGPCIVPVGQLDPNDLAVRSRLNGQVMQDACTADMIFSAAYLVSYLSSQFTLLPGTVICTGTPAGVGFARNPRVFLRAGDVISVEVGGIGMLTNPVRGPVC
ncbi:MAG TPA: fumarylacetoacetate hydrolase family protein [Phycisphaerae bacterium]|nr:fumarylacetoacetate hydrolase family protein [Phycisphaerae bacterium]HNU46980.1 fumarylacetoacetate hydrolase family protein [Phycisphaerae bacterium]